MLKKKENGQGEECTVSTQGYGGKNQKRPERNGAEESGVATKKDKTDQRKHDKRSRTRQRMLKPEKKIR